MSGFSLLDLFTLAGGLALFLYGMQLGEQNIRRIGSAQARKLIAVVTRHRLSAYVAGLVTTLITQSSSATTVILVGLVNARIMNLGQSLGMILGSDLGTTFTVQLFAFKFHQIAPLLIAAGFFTSLHRTSETIATAGRLVLAAGLVFFGMHLMAGAVTPLRTVRLFESALQASLTNPWYGLLAGTVITAIIQSSAATLTIVIALAQSMQGSPPSPAALFPVVMGANLGTCATAFLATFGAEISGIRVAWSHFFFKLFGIAVFLPCMPLLPHFSLLLPRSPALQIALLHTLFNGGISVLLLPFLHVFEKSVERVVRPGKEAASHYRVEYLTDSVVNFPVLALAQAVKEIGRMAEKVRYMASESLGIIQAYSLQKKSLVAECDNEVDFLHEHIIAFLTRMSRGELDNESAAHVYRLIMVTTDLEHIGDSVSKSIITLAEKIDASPLPLSAEGREEIVGFYRQTITDLNEVLAAFSMNDTELAQAVFSRKKSRDELYDRLFNRHMDRLFNRKPESLQTTSIHVDLLEEIRRIDHFVFRISAHILKVSNVD
ncbi:MAG: Na/Pi cotransporter family protein [Chitinispirillaceae bacterium]|nr:Na/Pi cotransporter family protein [Chitinispirillaceae bacterium]